MYEQVLRANILIDCTAPLADPGLVEERTRIGNPTEDRSFLSNQSESENNQTSVIEIISAHE